MHLCQIFLLFKVKFNLKKFFSCKLLYLFSEPNLFILEDFISNLNKLREIIFGNLTNLNNKLKLKTKYLLLVSTNKHCISLIRNALNLFEDPVLLNCKSGAEYLLNKII